MQDFGFAPGGMSHLLLSKHKGMRGSGVTLDPEQGGNVWPDWLDRDPRFFSCVGDVVDMAKDEVNLPQMLQLPNDFEGFDFVIVSCLFYILLFFYFLLHCLFFACSLSSLSPSFTVYTV